MVVQKNSHVQKSFGNSGHITSELMKYLTEYRHNLCNQYKNHSDHHDNHYKRIADCCSNRLGKRILFCVIVRKRIHNIVQSTGLFSNLDHVYKIIRTCTGGFHRFVEASGHVQRIQRRFQKFLFFCVPGVI